MDCSVRRTPQDYCHPIIKQKLDKEEITFLRWVTRGYYDLARMLAKSAFLLSAIGHFACFRSYNRMTMIILATRNYRHWLNFAVIINIISEIHQTRTSCS